MSAMLDDIVTRNLLNLRLDDAPFSQLKVPGPRLNRSASFFYSAPSGGCSSSARHSLSLSTERVDDNDDDDDDDDGNNDSFPWPANIWSQLPKPQQQFSFRPDRSMSLTESSSALLSSFAQLKGLEGFSSGPSGTTVAPPPGFAPSAAPLQAPPLTPTLLLPSNRYKTELCRGFQESGVCKYGAKCQFAHGEAELRGLHRHPKYKTEPCRTFYNFGYCPYGPRCHFLHEERSADGRLPDGRQASPHNPRHPLRQSVSFAGFLGSSRSSPPPPLPGSFTDLHLGFSRAASASPPPAASPVFGDALQARHHHQPRASAGDARGLPLNAEPESEPSRCVCGHGGPRAFPGAEDAGNQQGVGPKPSALQRFSSEDSLEDSSSSSSSSTGSSGTESPTFDGSASKRLTVFARLSLSD